MLDQLVSRLKQHLPGEIVGYPSIPTTMDLARGIAEADRLSQGLLGIVIAGEQTAGRGRQGRVWSSKSGAGLYCSISYRFEQGIQDVARLPLYVGVAICRVLRRFSSEVSLKWPNDLVTKNGRKLGGILVEGVPGSAGTTSVVIGFGINFNGILEAPAIALSELTGTTIDYPSLAEEIIRGVVSICEEITSSELLEEYRSYNILQGREISYLQKDEERTGTVTGVREDGALILSDETGATTYLFSGEVHLRRWS